ncbi:MAG TPA: pilus assembly protein PilM [Solirubrobacteraceae bacterium]
MQAPSFNLKLGRRGGVDIVGLDIQPGHVAAVQTRVNGAIVVKHAVGAPLPADTMREGEVLDEGVLAETLREVFKDGRLSRRVRLGVANQRTVLRTLELPPVTDRKDLAAAVSFQAQDQVPMPLSNAVLDFHPLGIVDTPAGPRQRVVLVAAQRDMVQRLLAAVRDAGLRPEGVDLSAFALIRSLYRPDPEHAGRVLYLNVDGLTNMAIAEGTICRFTRVVGGGIEAMASELAERRSIPLVEARALIASIDLTAAIAPDATVPDPVPETPVVEPAAPIVADTQAAATPTADAQPAEAPTGDAQAAEIPTVADAQADVPEAPAVEEVAAAEQVAADAEAPASAEDPDARERDMSFAEMASVAQPATPAAAPAQETQPAPDADLQVVPNADVRAVLENGIREIAGEVRNSLDFHRSQEGGGEVSLVVLSGSALDLPGFADSLQEQLGIQVERESVHLDEQDLGGVSAHRLAIAAGLSVEEAPQ